MSAEPTHKDTESRGNVSHVAHLIRTRRGVKLSSLDLDLQPHNLSYIYSTGTPTVCYVCLNIFFVCLVFVF